VQANIFSGLKNYLSSFYWPLITVALFLTGAGLITIWFISSPDVFFRQLLFAGIGLVLLLLFPLLDVRILREKSWLVLSIFLLTLLAIGSLQLYGEAIRGVKKWYRLGEFNFDPIELLKLVFIILTSKLLAGACQERQGYVILKSFLYFIVPVILIVLLPDFGSVVILTAIWSGFLFVYGLERRYIFYLAAFFIFVGLIAWFVVFLPYQKQRIISFFNFESELLTGGYNLRQSLVAIGHGGLFGQGFSRASQAQLSFLPEAKTDFIIASFGEATGLFGLTVLVCAWAGLVFFLTKNAFHFQEPFGFYLHVGLAFWVFAQGALNLGSAFGFLPVVGVTFPFVSYGGSSLISLYLALGLVQTAKIRGY
jgi:rod shape determining protein RodA